MQYTYVGIDSHKDTHTAVFIDCFFEKLGEIVFNNTSDEFGAFLSKAEKFKQDETTFMFGLEDVSSYGRALRIFLRGNNQPVKHVNAYLVAGERKNLTYTEKTDSIDAECAARLLISRFGSLPDAEEDEKYWLLRSLVVQRDFIMNSNVRLKTYLHSLLTQDFPQYHKFFYGIECKAAFAFFMKYPSAGTLKDVTAGELGRFLWENSQGKLSLERAEEILQATDTNATVHEIRNKSVQSTLKQYQYNMKELEKTENELAKVYGQFGTTLTSMTGLDIVSASQLLSCIGDIKKFSTPAKLAKYAGIAPKTNASGKKDSQHTNTRGNRELNSHFYQLAVRLIIVHESGRGTDNPECRATNLFFHEYYYRKISEGKTKRQALKCVQRRLVNIIWTMLTNNEEYINPPKLEVENPKKSKQ